MGKISVCSVKMVTERHRVKSSISKLLKNVISHYSTASIDTATVLIDNGCTVQQAKIGLF